VLFFTIVRLLVRSSRMVVAFLGETRTRRSPLATSEEEMV